MANDTVGRTIVVAAVLCIICSVLVSSATVQLKPAQEKNKLQFTRTNILKAAGLWQQGEDINSLFKNIEVKYVNIDTGEFVEDYNPANYDAREVVKKPDQSVAIPKKEDLAGIRRRVEIAQIYLVKENEQLQTIILPVYGKGLWSTMYGFLAVDNDGNTVKGLTFYDQGETPGLGGEIENPKWQAKWEGKKIYDDNWDLALNVLKGNVDEGKPSAIHQIDGLSGATLTTNGVRNLVHYWLGPDGFKKFLTNIRQQGVQNG